MRCNNCGWDNQQTAIVCIKCNTQLEKVTTGVKGPTSEDLHFQKTKSEQDLPHSENKVFAKTISENPVDNPASNEIEKDILIPCPNSNCGYLNPGDAIICAKCKTSLTGSVNEKRAAETLRENQFTPTVKIKIPGPGDAFKSTIDPYRKNNKHVFTLVPILREGEKTYSDNPPGGSNFFNNEFITDNNTPVALKRENLEKDNTTITGKVQAELYFEDNKWYIEDKSDLKTTFVHVKRKMELNDGDILLMGDRKFIFSVKDNTDSA